LTPVFVVLSPPESREAQRLLSKSSRILPIRGLSAGSGQREAPPRPCTVPSIVRCSPLRGCGRKEKNQRCFMAPERTSRNVPDRVPRSASAAAKPRCGLCGKTAQLTRTECCGRWICDDEHEYQLFSYARNSCHRNHRRLTLCGSHHAEGHAGNWKECKSCRKGCETELYVYYGTNEYNFEKLENPPPYQPTRCAMCRRMLNLSRGGWSLSGGQHLCEKCTFAKIYGRSPKRSSEKPTEAAGPEKGSRSTGRRGDRRR
jgi:hypothetical protein